MSDDCPLVLLVQRGAPADLDPSDKTSREEGDAADTKSEQRDGITRAFGANLGINIC